MFIGCNQRVQYKLGDMSRFGTTEKFICPGIYLTSGVNSFTHGTALYCISQLNLFCIFVMVAKGVSHFSGNSDMPADKAEEMLVGGGGCLKNKNTYHRWIYTFFSIERLLKLKM